MMSEQQSDFLDGLHVVAYELQRVIGELDEMQDRLGISGLDRVSLDPLQWALNKLADDLHDASAEICNARQYEASAKRGADTAQQKQLEEHVQWASFYNGLRAELHTVKAERDSLQRQVAELTEKLGELPDEEDEPFPEPYQWQVGDVVESEGESPRLVITRDAQGWVFFKESAFGLPQFEWEKLGWKIYRKAVGLPDLPPFTEQQVAEFAAVTEPIDDSTGAGEGQS
jgi:hypothetical protein